MDLQRWIASTLEIQAIPAPTFEEADRAELMQHEFRAARLDDVRQDQLGNVYGRIRGGSSAPVVVSAHLDTVFGRGTDLRAKQTRTRIIAPGVGDNAVALGALIELAHELNQSRPAGDLWLVANVGEEGLGNLRGMREVVSQLGDQVASYLVLEGMAFGHIYHRALPVRRYRVTGTTKGGHSWIHVGRPSAIHALIALGGGLLDIPLPRSPKTTLNIGTIQGGRSINSIADAATMELDLRSESETALEQLDQAVQATVQSASNSKYRLELELIGTRPAGELAAEHPLVQAAAQALSSVGENDHLLEAASTDASIPLNRGLPAVCVGVTKGGEAHTMNEYIELRPMPNGYRALRELIDRAFMLSA